VYCLTRDCSRRKYPMRSYIFSNAHTFFRLTSVRRTSTDRRDFPYGVSHNGNCRVRPESRSQSFHGLPVYTIKSTVFSDNQYRRMLTIAIGSLISFPCVWILGYRKSILGRTSYNNSSFECFTVKSA